MMQKNFIHLHVHTEYSLLDGAARISKLLDQAKEFGMSSIAITDHGTMYGTIDFYKAAVERGVKPIIGCEVYLAPKSRHDHASSEEGEKYFHLVLLAENNEGYKNLTQLVTLASMEGFYYKPRVDKELLRKYHGGIIALSACLQGEIPRAILQNNYSRAKEIAQEYIDIFGRENFYLEIQNHGINDEVMVSDALIKMSLELKIPLVATNDVHYVKQSDSEAHDILLCLQTNKTKNDEKRLKFYSDDYYLKSPDEMHQLFSYIPEACENTVKIAERCNVTFNFGEIHLPFFPIPEGFDSASEYLRELCRKKVYERYGFPDEKIFNRLNYELDVIKNMGYDGYFLIVQDFINFARKNKIAVGPGRGSAAGSVVAYVLGITEIDPLKFNLLFERFLNPERVTMPDIDIDFCYQRREEVIEYVKEIYGKDNVAQIVTFGTMAAKAAVRDVARVLNTSYTESSRIVNMIPNELKMTLDKALEISPKLKFDYENNEKTRIIIDLARELEGLPRHASVHAAGIVISKLPLIEYLPLQNLKGTTVTQFDKDKIEELGLLKMDFLGLRTLTIIDETVKAVKEHCGIEIDIGKIPLDDDLTAKMLSRGDTGAVFQMESSGMTKLVRELKPTCFQDLIPTIALFRPGPLGSGMVKDFVEGRHGRRKPTYFHPKLEPILRETFGVILYQEQVMQIVQALAGFTLGQADLLRRAMSKKKASILVAQKERFLKGCAENGIGENLAEKIFGLLEHFADYGFNKSHSAAYAFLAWQTAYLKAHYPAEFMAATLSSVMDSDKIAVYFEQTKRMGIKVLPPDINSSEERFNVRYINGEPVIYFALSAVKNLGENPIKLLIENRKENGNFTSLTDFCSRVDSKLFNRHAIENLIKCGAFDSISNNRKGFLDFLSTAVSVGRNSHGNVLLNGIFENVNDAEILALSVVQTSTKDCLKWEKETLGFYITEHPLEIFLKILSDCKTVGEIKNTLVKSTVKTVGSVTSCRNVITKNGDPMAFATVEYSGEKINVVIFPAIFERCKDYLAEDAALLVEGRTDFSKDEIVILADKVIQLEKYLPSLYLKFDENVDSEKKQTLKKIFAYHQGESEIYIWQNGKWFHTTKHGKLALTPEILIELKNLIGEDNVKVY